MAAHAWLAETPWPTKQLTREELQGRIEHFLATHWMGVLCTVGKNGPIGTPVEYHGQGLDVYILPQPGSPKVQAMKTNPKVCFAVYGENSGWASVHGAQLFGDAVFIEPGTPEHEQAMSIYRWAASAEQLGKPLDQPPQMPLIRIELDRVVYTQQWLRKEGYGPRQIWHSNPDKVGKSRQYGH